MSLKICQRCKRPFMAHKGICPHCPEPYTWNQESWMNMGCLLAMVLPLLVMLLFWFFFFFSFFVR